jgi:hypothetical protein
MIKGLFIKSLVENPKKEDFPKLVISENILFSNSYVSPSFNSINLMLGNFSSVFVIKTKSEDKLALTRRKKIATIKIFFLLIFLL